MQEHEHHFGRIVTGMFGLPRGPLGRLGGRLMVLEHGGIYRAEVDLLHPGPGERILEIGSGSGAAAALVAERAPSGFVAATDPSPVMVAQARRRLRATIEAGRAEAVQAPAEHLPFDDESFDGAFAIFTLHHWDDPRKGLSEVHRVLRRGGRLVIAERVQGHGGDSDSPETMSEDVVAETGALLSEAGFVEIERSSQRVGKRQLAILKARREPAG
jgi:ubiquinone/menaquinone biosynthesis C-methylase UbiE